MDYIDVSYYREEFQGYPVADENELLRLITRASRDILALNRFTITDYVNLHPAFQDVIKLAAAQQVEHLALNGEFSSVDSGGGNFSIGSYSESGGNSTVAKLSSDARQTLASAGLLYSGVNVGGGGCG